MKVSTIIVSYNVKYFLEQCLCSVEKAIAEWSLVNSEALCEVIVVDNHSSDGTIEYLTSLFPSVQFIANNENTGFARANNQALQFATGQYVLFLNPDTILPENFFASCIDHMELHPRIGALGVQMIDGTGAFLKESKRGFPSSWASFCKLSGLTALFPHSGLLSKYYLGNLDKDSSHQVDVLSGACMLIRKQALDKTKGFDERFFMYAEDIDLSYRIRQAGFTNYYYAETSIIHFKGESTKKDIRYITLFYRAMIQFVQKHYTGRGSRLYVKFLKTAIRTRAVLSVVAMPFRKKTSEQEAGRWKWLFKGDDLSISEARSLLKQLDQTRFVQSDADDVEIILCEGKNFSFTELIATLKSAPARPYKIHAHGTNSIVATHESIGSNQALQPWVDSR